jgi:hypothetical protein
LFGESGIRSSRSSHDRIGSSAGGKYGGDSKLFDGMNESR